LLEVVAAMHASLDLAEVTKLAFPSLRRLIPADHAALCISVPGRPEVYDWALAELPPGFFATYAQVAEDDFVRAAVLERPTVVLRDDDMAARRDIEQSSLYRSMREGGTPVEQAMAVLLDLGDGLHAGVTLYRAQRRPFSARERGALQRLVPHVTDALRNCARYRGANRLGDALGGILARRGIGVLVVDGAGAVVRRNELAEALLDRWAPPHALRAGLWPALALALGQSGHRAPAPLRASIPGAKGELRVAVEPLPGVLGQPLWVVELRERARFAALPPSWDEVLSPQERKVAALSLTRWTRARIARELKIAPETVKTHLKRVHEKLEVKGRGALAERARRDG
jgi:DNA-binding CsgD family transcriptional regulator